MDLKKYKIYLNREHTTPKEMKRVLKSIQNNRILKEKGGFLFQSSLNDSELHIGIVPFFIDGERTRHYDIELDYADKFQLSGFFNADGTIGMLFKPPENKQDMDSEYKCKIKKCYINTVALLSSCGLSLSMEFDWITKKIMEESKFSDTPPQTVGELVNLA